MMKGKFRRKHAINLTRMFMKSVNEKTKFKSFKHIMLMLDRVIKDKSDPFWKEWELFWKSIYMKE